MSQTSSRQVASNAAVTAAAGHHPAAPTSSMRSFGVLVGWGLHSQRRAPLWWGGGLGAMSGLIAALWPSISDSIGKAMQTYPENVKAAFGIKSLDTVEKYVDAEMLSLIVPLAIAFFAIRSATRAIVGAEEKGHLDPLLSLPLSRRVLVAGTFMDTAILAALSLVLMWAITWGAGTLAGTGISARILAEGFGNVWPISIAFAGFAVFLAGLLHRSAAVTAIATGTLVAMYVIDLVGKISPDLRPYRVVSAFRWYGSAVQDGMAIPHVAGLTLVGVLLAVIGAELFVRRDVL